MLFNDTHCKLASGFVIVFWNEITYPTHYNFTILLKVNILAGNTQFIMMTTRIEVRPHLKEYLIGRFNSHANGPVRFPDNLDLYHTIYDLLQKRPANAPPIDKGNLEIFLPVRHNGKKVEYYNYLGQRSAAIIEKKIETMMWAELHDLLDEQKHLFCIEYNETVFRFMTKYGIEAITEDAMLKNYYRWRRNVRKKEKTRKYKKKAA